jgi:Carboxypeptidase regulatory-like domain
MIAAAQQQVASLEGTVVRGNTKEPVRKAQVTLEASGDKHDSALVATTDEAGRFRFAAVEPGEYDLTAEKAGFLDGSYGAKTIDEAGSLLRVSGGERMQDLVLLLFPGASISGQVLDADGDPVSDDQVILWTREKRRGGMRPSHADQTASNHRGEYRFDGLPPGTYYVAASNAGSRGYAARRVPVDSSGNVTKLYDLTTFYPGALSLAEAQGVTVESGQEQSGIDIRIRRGPVLSVKGRIAAISDPAGRYTLSARVDDGAGWASEQAKILPNGDFVFPALPPGKHRLTLSHQGPNGLQMIGRAEVELTDQDVMGVVIAPFKPAQVRVRVLMEGEEDRPLTTGSVFLNQGEDPDDRRDQLMQYQPQDGAFTINNIPPGKYQVWFNNAPDGYLKSVQSGDRVLDADAVEVGEGAAIDLLMTFSKNVASLSGDVELPADQPKAPVEVLALPEEPGELAKPRNRSSGRADQSLHFSVDKIRPGKYRAFAVEDIDYDLWSNPDFVRLMAGNGVEVELHEKEQATEHLKVITKEEVEAARKRLGL